MLHTLFLSSQYVNKLGPLRLDFLPKSFSLVTFLKVPHSEESPLISRHLWTHRFFFLPCVCECRFSPGVANDPAPSTGPMKRRTQSLSALPKDGDRKVSPPCRQKRQKDTEKQRISAY